MRSFFSFFKKELLESLRSGKLLLLAILFLTFGIMNPAIAKLTPWMLELMADSLAESGMTVTEVSVDALTSWTQFFKNIPMALIAFLLLYASAFTREYESGTLVLLLTRGLARWKVVLAKALTLIGFWSAGYWLCFAVTYCYNAYFWDNSIAVGLAPAVTLWWLFGVWTLCLLVFFSTLSKSSSGVLLGTGGTVLAAYLVGLFPKLTDHTPAALMSGMPLLVGTKSVSDYALAVAICLALSVICLVGAVLQMQRRQI